VQAIPLAILIPLTFFIPETPRWLVLKDRTDQALQVIRKLHQTPDNEAFIQGEYQEIMDQIHAEREMLKPSWGQVIKKKSWRRRIILSAVLQIFSQLTGINCIQYYTGMLSLCS
jgi:hypothetical protein